MVDNCSSNLARLYWYQEPVRHLTTSFGWLYHKAFSPTWPRIKLHPYCIDGALYLWKNSSFLLYYRQSDASCGGHPINGFFCHPEALFPALIVIHPHQNVGEHFLKQGKEREFGSFKFLILTLKLTFRRILYSR